MAKIQSVEPNVADLANGWLKSYKLDYKLEQESLNTEIDQALNDYYSKNGGVGGNRPDAKLLLQDKNLGNYPILIEYKGYKDKLVKKASCNLRDTDHAKERYQELVDLVRFGKSKLNIFTEKEYYEGKIDPNNGADWNQTAPIDTKPTLDDFKKTVSDSLAWEVSNLLKNQGMEDDRMGN